jgi:hypothetical protein
MKKGGGRWRSVLMKAKTLESKQDLVEFQEAYRKISGLTVSLDYLAYARVMGIYCAMGNLKAGYVINFSGPYRYELYLTEEERKSCAIFQEPLRNKVIEITCVWADRATFCTAMLRAKVLLNILRTLFQFRDREMIVSTFIPGLERMFIRYFPNIVYAGSTTFFGPPRSHRILQGNLKTVLQAALPELFRRIGLAFKGLKRRTTQARQEIRQGQDTRQLAPIPVRNSSDSK